LNSRNTSRWFGSHLGIFGLNGAGDFFGYLIIQGIRMKKTFVAALLLSVISTMLHAQGADSRAGKNKYPKLTAEDLAVCKNEIVEFNRLETIFHKEQAQKYCTKTKATEAERDWCNVWTEQARLSSSRSDLMAWFMKGSDNCQSEYPCFGIFLDDNENLSEEDLRSWATQPVEPPEKGEEFRGYASVVDQCTAKVLLAKLERSRSAGGAGPADENKPNGPLGPFGPVIGTGLAPGATVPAGNAPGAVVPHVAGVGGLSPQQIASCSEEIRHTQLESQTWPGTSIDVAARLGRFQKELFEGRCAGHPEAQAYLAGANKMIGYGGNPAVGGSPVSAAVKIESPAGNLAPLQPGTNSTGHDPDRNTTKSEYLDPETGLPCVTPTNGPQDSEKYGKFYFQNTCALIFSIQIAFTDGTGGSNGIGRGSGANPSKSHLNCLKSAGQCAGAKWEVR
jgi:hypothetical protein